MKKCPFRLDAVRDASYALKVGEEVYGPYRSETSARKAAGRAGVRADIYKLEVTVNATLVTGYTPPAKDTKEKV